MVAAPDSQSTIPTVPSGISHAEAFDRFFVPNKPFIVKGGTSQWPASKKWIDHEASAPDWEYLRESYGGQEVGVVDCGDPELCPSAMKFEDVIRLWEKGQGESLYIKDWHLKRASKEAFYESPAIFQDDWMNGYYANCTEDDFAFVYFGRKGTYTPLHRDVYTSYSWSANVHGRKRWHFVAPDEIKYCRRFPEVRTSEMIADIRNVDRSVFKHFDKVHVITVEQDEDSVIFVPSNWYHFVENLSDFVISINHNWCNSVNLPSMYRSMCEEVEDTEDALSDVKELLFGRGRGPERATEDVESEWIGVVQDVVRQNAGWDWLTFWKMVAYNLATPAAEAHLRPSEEFVSESVTRALADFETRLEPQRCLPLQEAIVAVRKSLSALRRAGP